MKKVFFIGGLGVDHSILKDISLKNCEVIPIDYLITNLNSSLEVYCKTLTEIYKFSNSIIIGVSFGGLIAVEIARIVPVEKIILISSFRAKNEIPLFYRLMIRSRFYLLFSPTILCLFPEVLNYFFSVSKPQDKKILLDVIRRTNVNFFRWAIGNILNSNQIRENIKIVRIHGNNDRILPLKKVKADIIINEGGHFMVFDKKEEVENAIYEAINHF